MTIALANLTINVLCLCYLLVTLPMLLRRKSLFDQFMELLQSIEEQHQHITAIREDWERREEGNIEGPS